MHIKQYYFLNRAKIPFVFTGIILFIAAASLSFSYNDKNANPPYHPSTGESDNIASQNAFLKVYEVLMSPRCMNCHPAGDVPLNGDDNHLHPQGVKRGVDGKGLYALKCSNCHQSKNRPGLNMPPGAEGWHLPASGMRLVFQGKSPHELATQLKDRKRNGNKSLKDLVQHMKTPLVKWAWQPGDGRSIPPMSYEEFFNQFKLWIDKGAAVPPAGTR